MFLVHMCTIFGGTWLAVRSPFTDALAIVPV